jgi:hypothetical protein
VVIFHPKFTKNRAILKINGDLNFAQMFVFAVNFGISYILKYKAIIFHITKIET